MKPVSISRQSLLFALPAALGMVFLAGIGLMAISGCDSGSGGGRTFVTIGTAPGGGAFAQVGNAIANALDAAQGDLNWSVTAQGTKGTQENIRKLEAGDIEFGMANAAIAYFATRGEGDWETPRDIRVVATMAPNVGVFVTTRASGIKTIADLKGKRVVLGPSGAGFDYFLKPLLAVHGVSYEDMEAIPGNYVAASELIADGKADAAFMGGAIPIPAVTSLCATQDVVFLKFDEDAPQKLMQQLPFYFPVTITADKYSDLKEDMTGINVGSMLLITHANVPEEMVYQLTKLLYENQDAVTEQHPAGKALAAGNIVRDTGTPFHPGAIRYYREIGIWPETGADNAN
jgi:TRAP transporter TAXI family solute receptor